jgi:D-3-phosphoglycerate dehydrogenase
VNRVILTDQVFPDTEIERELLGQAGATLEIPGGDRERVLTAAESADAVLTTYFPLGRADIARLGRCRIIARYGIGVDNIDLAAAAERGIVVTNVPDYCVQEVACHAVAMLLSLLRKLPWGHQRVLAGEWGVGGLRPLRRPSEVTAGLVGFGRIGRRVATALGALGMRVLTHDPMLTGDPGAGAELVTMADLLRRSDAVSLHCPLTPQTRGLIGARELTQMPSHAVLVNTSRGPLVRFGELAAALHGGQIAAAALDVFEDEPPVPAALADVPNLLVTPHVAYYSEAALRESQKKAATQVVKVLAGQSPDYPVG